MLNGFQSFEYARQFRGLVDEQPRRRITVAWLLRPFGQAPSDPLSCRRSLHLRREVPLPVATAAALRRLETLRLTFGPAAAAERFALFGALARARLSRAADVLRLHEVLLFARSYPDDADVLARCEAMLSGFARRADIREHRAALADTGIAGSDIAFRFFAPTARRLARRWPERLTLDWSEFEHADALETLLPLLVHGGEVPGLDEWDLGLPGWIARMKGAREGDAAFVTRRIAGRFRDDFVFEKVHDGLDMPMRLAWGSGGPSRTLARWPVRRTFMQREPFAKQRPDLARELRRPPVKITALSPREGERALTLAMEAMVTRTRDLDVFAWGDPRDVRRVDCGNGLEFLMIGALPARRLLLESVYGFLTLKNGVPTGYVLTSALFGSAEIAYNVFETYRGAEAAPVYARVLAMTRHLFGVDAFTIYPYQLGGAGNEEGLASGAWWFYRKLGFAPKSTQVRALVRAEEARMRKDPSHRSSRATLERLAAENVYWFLGAERDDVIGELPLANVGLAVTDALAKRFGSDREAATLRCNDEASRLLGVRTTRWSRDERAAWTRWAPVVALLPGVARWSAAERRALAAVIRAKGGRRESDFVRIFDAHGKLRRSLARLARSVRA